jgi:hypothetical protein
MRRQARLAQDLAAALEGRGVASARRDPALAPLLALAQGLQTVPLAPSADFRDALRQRLLAVATVAPAPVAVPSPLERAKTWVEGWRVQKAIAGLAASMAAVVGVSGVSVAASRSLPGDALYGVKRTAESVQVSMARNDVNRGKRHLQHAETRLHEVAGLVDTPLALAPLAPVAGGAGSGQITMAFGGSKSAKVAGALHAMDAETRDGTRLLFAAYAEDGRDEAVLAVVRDFTLRQRDHLGQLLDVLPTEAHDDAEASLALVSSLNLRATQLLAVGTCGDQCAPVNPPAPAPGESTPTPSVTPSYDALGPVPCTCPGDPTATGEPAPAPEPQPTPTPTSASPTPTPTETAQPSPEPTGYQLPSQVPSPVASPVESAIDQVNEQLPTPLPTLPPLPGVDAPLVPGTPAPLK